MSKMSDRIFDIKLEHACEQFVDSIVSEYPSVEELEENYSVSVSPEIESWVAKVVESENKQLRRKLYKQAKARVMRAGQKVAIVICCVFAVFLLLAFTVPPIRVGVLNFFTRVNDDYVEMDLQKDDSSKISTSDYDLNLPEGFEVINVTENDTLLTATVVDGAGNEINIERYVGSGGLIVDDENSRFEKMMVGDHEAYISAKDGIITILTHNNDYGYTIISNADIEILIKAAESLLTEN